MDKNKKVQPVNPGSMNFYLDKFNDPSYPRYKKPMDEETKKDYEKCARTPSSNDFSEVINTKI